MGTDHFKALRDLFTRCEVPFLCGTLPIPPDSQTLFYNCGGTDETSSLSSCIKLNESNTERLESLASACEPATFGRDQQDVLDESYRKAAKMDKNKFSLQLDINSLGLLDRIRDEFLSDNQKLITAELYKLNIYGKGSFFKSHRDTPRSESMFGSLVLVLPTPHEGGELILRHGDHEWKIDSSELLGTISEPSVAFIVFYSDVEHEVALVKSGHRVTITYNLYFNGSNHASSVNVQKTRGNQELKAALSSALTDPQFLPEGGFLGFGLNFRYPVDSKGMSLTALAGNLKGKDSIIKNVCNDLGLDAQLNALYETDPDVGCKILTAAIPNLGRVETSLECFLCSEFGGKAIEEKHGVLSEYDLEEFAANVTWLTEPTNLSRFSSPFLAYGNEAELDYAYADLCLIVPVGGSGNRTLPPKKMMPYGDAENFKLREIIRTQAG